MNIGVILSAILVPLGLILFFSALRKSSSKASEKASDENFVVMLPHAVLMLGIFFDLILAVPIIGVTFFSEELPHIIFFIVFGSGIFLGTYLALKALRFKVIVKGKEITVHNIFGEHYTFMFSEIILVVRRVKKNRVKSERMVIKTKSGKKLIVESAEIAYDRFLKRIKSEVKGEYLFGFDP